jgi:two-component system, NtrC family, response regulator PilR
MPNYGKKILIVDDFGSTASILAEMLNHFHVNTESAGGPEEAFLKLRDNEYDLVIADSRMPRVNGVSLLKQVRHCCPNTKIALMSTFDSVSTQRVVAIDGIDYYLPKPVKLSHLERIIADLEKQDERKS